MMNKRYQRCSMEYLLSSAGGYLLGSVNPAYLIGRLKGFDIREKGTGNAGASNAKLVMGWPYFFICAGYDILKAIIAYGIVNLIYPGDRMLCVIAGCGAVIGHCLPFYLGFKGGKGFATYIGLCFLIEPLYTLIALIVLLILSYLARYILVATFGLTITMPVLSFINAHGILLKFTIVLIAALVVVYKHNINIKRFIKNEELDMNGNHIGIAGISSFFH